MKDKRTVLVVVTRVGGQTAQQRSQAKGVLCLRCVGTLCSKMSAGSQKVLFIESSQTFVGVVVSHGTQPTNAGRRVIVCAPLLIVLIVLGVCAIGQPQH